MTNGARLLTAILVVIALTVAMTFIDTSRVMTTAQVSSAEEGCRKLELVTRFTSSTARGGVTKVWCEPYVAYGRRNPR